MTFLINKLMSYPEYSERSDNYIYAKTQLWKFRTHWNTHTSLFTTETVSCWLNAMHWLYVSIIHTKHWKWVSFVDYLSNYSQQYKYKKSWYHLPLQARNNSKGCIFDMDGDIIILITLFFYIRHWMCCVSLRQINLYTCIGA